ncbi:HNH endonuclease [Cellulomonas iranensis]|uniref:HNH endonuclease n=1 Tax=Cellulomonas iranensis TaxID=76862 RepID=UPI001177A462
MPRAPKKCANPTCETRVVGRTYCDEHRPVGWSPGGSHRTGTAEHKAWRREVLRAAKYQCQIRGPRCQGRAREADHIQNVAAGGALYDVANGQAACVPCHRSKTLREAQAGRNRAR